MIEPTTPDGSPGPVERAVVLGPGGMVGTAWMAGLAGGLRRDGVDLADADLVVGTSAGAIVGAVLTTGQDLDRLAALPPSADPDGATPKENPDRLAEVFAVLGDPSLEPAAARRRVGRLALAAETGTEHAHVTQISSLIAAREWPDRRLLIIAVDIETGEPQVWDRDGGAPLPAVVASSCAMPGIYPPITVNGRRYMDGALRSGSNADLASDARMLVVVEPLAHLFPASPPPRDTIVTIAPDQAALDVFGPTLHDRTTWEPAYQAGVRQAAEAARRIRAVWRDSTGST
ncbi:patatin-like phospholipase family protein [Streptosporangium amethystogenes]|uniref:patatin-like phospholipase family protein n=1 Tax=Streptosporangium amethystogenes TaxID=2002 RepID=UPI00068C97BF|nr:patatin-like phospholipase family protein [Streptosporangium amethystogenes]